MRLLALTLVAALAAPAVAETGKVSLAVVGEANLAFWTRGSDSWQELTGELEVDNGLDVAIDGVHLELVYYRAPLIMKPGENLPPIKVGQDDATIWFAAPVPAGPKPEL